MDIATGNTRALSSKNTKILIADAIRVRTAYLKWSKGYYCKGKPSMMRSDYRNRKAKALARFAGKMKHYTTLASHNLAFRGLNRIFSKICRNCYPNRTPRFTRISIA
jgi:hypothetical protein